MTADRAHRTHAGWHRRNERTVQIGLSTAFFLGWSLCCYAQRTVGTPDKKAAPTIETAPTYEEARSIVSFFEGDRGSEDLWLAVALVSEDAKLGDASSQDCLAFLYQTGQGIPQNYTQSAIWFRKAADQGDSEAESNLGFLYDQGRGVPQDYQQAAMWFQKAAERGNSGAQTNLGVLYESGRGVEKDFSKAYFWLSVGLAGYKGGTQRRDTLEIARTEAAKHLTPSKLTAIQRQAGEWFEKHKPANAAP